METEKMKSRKCEVCNIDNHRASYSKHLRSKYQLQNEKQIELIIPGLFFNEPIEIEIKNICNPKSLKQIARDNIKLDDKQLNKELAEEVNNPYYFFDRVLQVGFKINLDTHHINHANSKLTFRPKYPEFGIEVRYIIKIIKECSVIYARLKHQYKFNYQTVFLTIFDEHDEDNKVLEETELFINLINNHNLTETDIDNIDVKSPLEHHIQQQEMNDTGWSFDKINSLTIYFIKLVN